MDDELLRVNEPAPAYDANIPAPVLYDESLPDGAKLLYATIRALCRQKGFCWASNRALAAHRNVRPERVSIWITALARSGHLVIESVQTERSHRRIYLSETALGLAEKRKAGLAEKRKGLIEYKSIVVLAGQAEQIYSAYPRKAERPRAIGAIKKALRKISFAELLAKTKAFAEAVQGAEQRFIKHPATWFNNECWNDGEAEWQTARPIPRTKEERERDARRQALDKEYQRAKQKAEKQKGNT